VVPIPNQNQKQTPRLNLVWSKELEAVKELLSRTILGGGESVYQPVPKLRLRSTVMGGSSIDRDRDTYISQSITELLERTIVK